MSRKSIFYKMFGLGKIPKEIHPAIEAEGLVLVDEGVSGWMVSKNLRTPTRRCRYRKEGFVGSLLLTKRRFALYSLKKRQINIEINDPLAANIFVSVSTPSRFTISFDTAAFHENCTGQLTFHINTHWAPVLFDHLIESGFSTLSQR